MPAPSTRHGRAVTGKARFRESWTGKLILQVEVMDTSSLDHEIRLSWIDADVGDLFPLRYHRKRRGLEPIA